MSKQIEQRLTPTEILEEFPILKRSGWNIQGIGYLVRMKILNGVSGKFCYVERQSLLNLIQYINTKIESQKIIVKP